MAFKMAALIMNLPAELRDKIWGFVFGLRPEDRPARLMLRSDAHMASLRKLKVIISGLRTKPLLLVDRQLGVDAQMFLFAKAENIRICDDESFHKSLATRTDWGPL